jgi:glycopeptide antibiotics resistance protein
LLTVLLFSAAIEAVQYAANLGWCEIDDVICNVLGAAIGFGLWKLIKGKMHAV